jgi:hypothetical protein
MKKLFQLFTLLIICGIIFSSCKDEDKTEPTGAIKATVSPAGSATNMRVTQGSTTLEITPDGSGIFQANNLTASDYSVSFTPTIGFQSPAARTATVTAGNTTDLGTVYLTQPGGQFLGTMSASVNNIPWNAAVPVATIQNGTLTITGSTANTSGGTISGEAIFLTIPNATGLGTFNGPVNAIASFTQGSISGGAQSSWSSVIPVSSCFITITKFDQVNQKISGTFSFSANPVPNTSATGTKVVNNGTFTDLNLQ